MNHEIDLLKSDLKRRAFLKTGALGAAAVSCLGVSSLAAQKVAPGTIIDTHTHFYDPSRAQGIPWPDKTDRLLYRTVLPKDYRELAQPRRVTGTVVVEASAWVEDNQWILDLAARDPFIVGFVGHLPVGQDGFRPLLKRFSANQLFRGLRVGGDRLRAGLADARFLADLKLLAAKNLALDVLGGPDVLPDVARLAREIPDLRIVIDHVANLRIDGHAPDASWTDGMRSVAKQRRVFCKVSGLVEGTGRSQGDAPKDVAFYQPVLDVVWQEFGANRVVYGSNWPVSERFASCATVQRIVTDYFSTKGPAASEKFFWKNAFAVYQWIYRGNGRGSGL